MSSNVIDNSELQEIMDKLESLEDEQLAVQLLKEFSEKTKILGELLMNLDPSLSSDEWKIKCQKAKKEVDKILKKIRAF